MYNELQRTAPSSGFGNIPKAGPLNGTRDARLLLSSGEPIYSSHGHGKKHVRQGNPRDPA